MYCTVYTPLTYIILHMYSICIILYVANIINKHIFILPIYVSITNQKYIKKRTLQSTYKKKCDNTLSLICTIIMGYNTLIYAFIGYKFK